MRTFLALCVITSFELVAKGQSTIWQNDGSLGGDNKTFESVKNWNGGLPVGQDAYILPGCLGIDPTHFTTGGSLNINISGSSNQSSGRFNVQNGALGGTPGVVNLTWAPGFTLTDSAGTFISNETLNITGNYTDLSSINVGQIAPGSFTDGSATLNFISGTLNAGSKLAVGTGSTFTDTFTQTGSTTSTVIVSTLGIGDGGGTKGIYTLGGTGINNLTATAGGSLVIGNGTFTQSNSNSTVDFSQASSVAIGQNSGDNGTYALNSGTLKFNNTSIGAGSGSTGTLTQTGGTFTSTGFFAVGNSGTGSYTISAGTADFQSGLLLGNGIGSVGTVTQSGGTVTSEGLVTIGSSGTGTYTLTGGTATFSSGVAVGSGSNLNLGNGVFSLGTSAVNLTVLTGGTVTQTAGTVTINNETLGQQLDLSSVGGNYNLNGGILQVDSGSLLSFGPPSANGNLNFGGGTLQVIGTGTTFVNPYNGTLTGGTSTIDASNGTVNTVVMNGSLSGTGGIRFLGSSASTAFSFGSANTYTGATVIETGTLTADTSQVGSSSLINIVNANSTLNLSTFNTGVNPLHAALTGVGALNVSFATAGDTLELANAAASNFTGSLNIGGANGNAGTLQIFNGTFGAITDTHGTGSGVTIGGDPAVATSGAVTFTQNQTYTGLTTINSGFTVLAPSFAGSVTNSGTLGTLGNFNHPAALLIGGSLTSAGGTLVFNSNANAIDSIGTAANPLTSANLSGKVLVVGTGSRTNVPIVYTSGGVTIGGNGMLNDPNGLTTNPPTALFSSTLSIVGNDLDITTIQNTLGSFAKTPNQAAVAGVIDPIINSNGPFTPGFNRVLTALNTLTPGQIPYALESLTPQQLQYSRNIAFEGATFLVQRMNNVDSDQRAGYGGLDSNALSVTSPIFNSSLGRSLHSMLASNAPSFHSAAPNGVNYYPSGGSDGVSDSGTISAPESSPMPGWEPSSQVISDTPNPYLANQHPEGPETPAFSEFISGDFVLADLNTDLNAQNAPSSSGNYQAVNVTAGVAYRVTSNFSAGVLFDYDHTDAKTDSYGSHMKVDTFQPGLFATYFSHGFYANALFTFGYNEYHNERDIQFLGNKATSTPSGDQFVGDLDFGYDFHPDKNWVAGPTLGITYTQLNVDSFTESGAPGANLAVQSQQAESLRTRLGGHVIFQTNTGNILLQPNVSAVWQHEYLNDPSAIISSFSDFNSSSFTINTTAPGRDSALISVGLSATLNTSLTLYINYMTDVGADNYFAQSVVGGFKARF